MIFEERLDRCVFNEINDTKRKWFFRRVEKKEENVYGKNVGGGESRDM